MSVNLRATEFLGCQKSFGELGVERECRHLLAQGSQLPGAAALIRLGGGPHRRPQQLELPEGSVDGVLGRRLQKVELGNVCDADGQHLEYDVAQAAPLDLRYCGVRQAAELLKNVEYQVTKSRFITSTLIQ